MDDDLDLRHFNNRCRLFPLPRVVLFPHAVLALHIFEPRYRQMTEDALAQDKMITMVQLRCPTRGTIDTLGSPPIETVACLGRILQHERLPDGRFNFLLLGRRRVRLTREVPSDRLYRIAEAELLDEQPNDPPDESQRQELVSRFRSTFARRGNLPNELEKLLEQRIPLCVLTDIVAHAMSLPPDLAQALLAETHALQRTSKLIEILRELGDDHPTVPLSTNGAFPPPFSRN